MMKNLVLAVCLLSLAFAVGCAKGGNGIVNTPTVSAMVTAPAGAVASAIYPTQTVTVTATITNSSATSVNWSLSGAGTLTPSMTNPLTATYVAPSTPLVQPSITVTLPSDSSVTYTLQLDIVDITTQISPASPYIGTGLTQMFTAVAVPDDAPQSFVWTCTANGVACANFTQDPNISGLAYYKAEDNCSANNCVQISAVTPLDTNGCSASPKYCIEVKATPVASRLNGGTYAFRFSGYDSSNHPVAVAGTFTANTSGVITGGVEDELTSSGPNTQIAISGGSYTPTSSDTNNSNNAGTLTLTLPSGIYPRQFQVVLDAAGDVAMIESDNHGTGSGVAEPQTSKNGFNSVEQTYAFGFTGVDSDGNRIGYAGLMPMNNANNTISGGVIDVNDNGNSKNGVCGSTPPCSLAGSYTQNANGSWSITLTSPIAMTFDFYVANGVTGKASDPLTLYAISTDGNPTVVGTMVQQTVIQGGYTINAFDGYSVSALTGVANGGTNVSLTLGETDGVGDFFGVFDQNAAGTVLSAIQFPQKSTAYTYSAASSNNGRYIFQMLGNPGASPVVAPIPFILYASGANRGFLLDQASAAVMTGTMSPQGNGSGDYDPTELPGTYAAATISSGNASAIPLAANLLLTSTGNATYNVTGTVYPGGTGLPTGSTYTLMEAGNGTIVLNSSTTDTYAIYTVDTTDCVFSNSNPVACAIQDFFMIDEGNSKSPNANPTVIYAHQ